MPAGAVQLDAEETERLILRQHDEAWQVITPVTGWKRIATKMRKERKKQDKDDRFFSSGMCKKVLVLFRTPTDLFLFMKDSWERSTRKFLNMNIKHIVLKKSFRHISIWIFKKFHILFLKLNIHQLIWISLFAFVNFY